MKTLIFIFTLLCAEVFALPQYRMIADSFSYPAPNKITFSIRMESISDEKFFLSGGQALLTFPPNFLNSGYWTTTIEYSLLPNAATAMIHNHFIYAAGPAESIEIKQLTLVARVSIETSVQKFGGPITVFWRDSGAGVGNPFTKIYADMNGENVNITNPQNHIVNYLTGISNNNEPVEYRLLQNYPNPFNPVTNIGYQIKSPGIVRLEVFNILGQSVKILVNDFKQSGRYDIKFDGTGFSSGVYFYKLITDEFTDSKTFLLIK